MPSLSASHALLPLAERKRILASLTETRAEELFWDWLLIADVGTRKVLVGPVGRKVPGVR